MSNHPLYDELIYAVERKFPGESRHETALRYIREAERRATEGEAAKAAEAEAEDDDERRRAEFHYSDE